MLFSLLVRFLVISTEKSLEVERCIFDEHVELKPKWREFNVRTRVFKTALKVLEETRQFLLLFEIQFPFKFFTI